MNITGRDENDIDDTHNEYDFCVSIRFTLYECIIFGFMRRLTLNVNKYPKLLC